MCVAWLVGSHVIRSWQFGGQPRCKLASIFTDNRWSCGSSQSIWKENRIITIQMLCLSVRGPKFNLLSYKRCSTSKDKYWPVKYPCANGFQSKMKCKDWVIIWTNLFTVSLKLFLTNCWCNEPWNCTFLHFKVSCHWAIENKSIEGNRIVDSLSTATQWSVMKSDRWTDRWMSRDGWMDWQMTEKMISKQEVPTKKL